MLERLRPSSGPRWASICISGPPAGPLRSSGRYGSPGRTCPGAHLPKGKSLIPELPIPPAPPTISIRECQEAIEIAGVITITLRGEQMRITEIATRGISRWVSGDIRLTPKEKELLTKRAREIIVDKGKSSPIAPPRKDRPRRHPASRGPICAPPPKFARSILSDCRCEVYPQAAVILGSFRQVVRSGCSCGQTDPETEPRNKAAAAAGVSFFYFTAHAICDTKVPEKMSSPRKWTKSRAFPHRLGMTIDDELLNRLDAVAGSLEISRAEVMRRVLRAGIDDLHKKEIPLLRTNQE